MQSVKIRRKSFFIAPLENNSVWTQPCHQCPITCNDQNAGNCSNPQGHPTWQELLFTEVERAIDRSKDSILLYQILSRKKVAEQREVQVDDVSLLDCDILRSPRDQFVIHMCTFYTQGATSITYCLPPCHGQPTKKDGFLFLLDRHCRTFYSKYSQCKLDSEWIRVQMISYLKSVAQMEDKNLKREVAQFPLDDICHPSNCRILVSYDEHGSEPVSVDIVSPPYRSSIVISPGSSLPVLYEQPAQTNALNFSDFSVFAGIVVRRACVEVDVFRRQEVEADLISALEAAEASERRPK